MVTKRKKSIVLLENEKQVQDYIKWMNKVNDKKITICLSPFAMYEMDKRGLSYHIPEDYYEPGELYKLGKENYLKVERLCRAIDELIQDADAAFRKFDISPAFFSFFHVKTAYDAVTTRLFQLNKIIEAENPDVLYFYGSEIYPFPTEMAPYLYFDNRESIYSRLLECNGWNTLIKKIPPVSDPVDFDILKNKKFSERVLNFLIPKIETYPELYDLAAIVREMGLNGLINVINKLVRASGARVLMIGGESKNWDLSRKELESMGINPLFLRIRDDLIYWLRAITPDEKSAKKLQKAWKNIRTNERIREFFLWRSIDFFPVMEERLRFLTEGLAPVCLRVYEKTTEIIKRYNVRCVLANSLFSCLRQSIAKAAKDLEVPVVVWQHGAYGYMDQLMIPYNDFMGSNAVLVWGEGVVSKYLRDTKRFKARLIPVGSANLDAIIQTNREKNIKLELPSKKTVLYVTTCYYQNNLYLASPPPFSDNLFWHAQCMIMKTLARHRGYQIVIKLHPNPRCRQTPMPLYAAKKFENCQFIKNEYTFSDLLTIADVFVIDFPSTTLLEALTTSKPIFVYTGHLSLDKKALKLLKRRAFCCSNLEVFTKTLDRYLKTGEINSQINVEDKEFLKMYGISKQGVGSGMRAAKTIKEIISGMV